MHQWIGIDILILASFSSGAWEILLPQSIIITTHFCTINENEVLTFSWRRRYQIALICGANQWTGFYMITTPVMKELSNSSENFVELSGQYPGWIPFSEAVIQRCSWKRMLWRYAANLQENTHAELRSHFSMGVFL